MATAPGVLLDVNAYRLAEPRFVALVELERSRGVARYADPFVLTELLAHLADPHDPDFGWCQSAVIRMYRRCGADGPCGILRDTESRVNEFITGKGIAKHEAHTEQLRLLLMHVGSGRPLSEIQSQLSTLAVHVSQVEAEFADYMGRSRDVIRGALDHEDPEERSQLRKKAMASIASEFRRMQIAERLVEDSLREAGAAVPTPVPAELVTRVRQALAVGIEFQAHLLRVVLFDGANLDASHIRNLRWDQRIAYNIGCSIGGQPLWVVTDDSAFATAATPVGLADRVHTLAGYEQWLRT
jgi:hypothetical protein